MMPPHKAGQVLLFFSLAVAILLPLGLQWKSRPAQSAENGLNADRPVAGPEAIPSASSLRQPSPAASPDQLEPVDPRKWPSPEELNWQDARILSIDQLELGNGSPVRQSVLIEPAHLPYPVRIDRTLVNGKAAAAAREYLADRLIVRLKEGASAEGLSALLHKTGARIEKPLGPERLFRIQLSDTSLSTYQDVLALLNASPGLVEFAEGDLIQRVQSTYPDDPAFAAGKLWGHENTGQRAGGEDTDAGTFGIPDADADLPEAWDIRTDASSVTVAVIDTGVLYTHEDLRDNMWINASEAGGLAGVDDDGNGVVDDIHGLNAITDLGDPLDDHRHGTHVAGIIGAAGNNALGISGVAWKVRLMACKFASADGTGATSDALEAVDYSVRMGADIINLSYGSPYFSEAALSALQKATEAGAIIVCASGNFSWDVDEAAVYPAGYFVENLVSVAATDRRDELAEFSNYSAGLVHLAAPGVSIHSTVIESNSAYQAENGTSMASPMVAGTLALLRAQFPDADPGTLVNRLLTGAERVEGLESLTLTSARLNARNALDPDPVFSRPFNDDFARRKPLEKELNFVRLQNHGATIEPGEPRPDPAYGASLWLSYTPASSGFVTLDLRGSNISRHLAAYTGDSLDSLVPVPVTGPTGDFPYFPCEQGVTYHIAISGKPVESGLIIASVAGPPSNNDLKDADPLEGLADFASGTLINATLEENEPLHTGIAGTGSIWWKWTAPVSARVALSTRGRGDEADFAVDTLLAVYTSALANPQPGDLVELTANDNEPGFVSSRVAFEAVQGRTYYIAVAAKDEGGPVSMRLLLPPSNDDFSNAVILRGDLPINATGSTLDASREPGEPNHDGTQGGFSVWYRYTAPEDFLLQIDTTGSVADTVLGVYTGDRVDQLTRLTSDNNSGPGTAASVVLGVQRNTTYHIAVDYLDAFFGAEIKLNLAAVERPPNDDFADRGRLEGARVQARGSNVGASRERFDPGTSPSIWYTWQAPRTERFAVYLDTLNGWRTFLSVHQGNTLEDLAMVAEDRSSGVGRDAFLEFDATAGAFYNIQILGENNESGEFDISIRPAHEMRPPNDNFTEATVLDAGTVLFSYPTYNYGATSEPGEPVHAGLDGRHSIWWKVTAGAMPSRMAFSTAGSEPDEVGIAVYSATSPGAPSVNALNLVADNSADTDSFYTEVEWDAVPGITYYIAVDANKESGVSDGGGRIRASFQQVPENDAFAKRAVVPSGGGAFTTYNFGTSVEAGEPMPAGSTGTRSLWWTFTPAESGLYQIDTFGSRYFGYEDTVQHLQRGTLERGLDTELGIYSGNTLYSLVNVAENDSHTLESYDLTFSTRVRNSRVIVALTAGVPYQILVNAENVSIDNLPRATATGEVRLNVRRLQPPPNDDFESAERVHGNGFIQRVADNSGATRQAGEPVHGISGNSSLWWKWTAPQSGPWVASTTGLLFDNDAVRDTAIGVYTGSTLHSLNTVGLDNDSAGVNWNSSALVTFEAVAGTTYYFAVDAAGDSRGKVSFILTPPPANDAFADAIPLEGSRVTATGHNIGATNDPGQPEIETFPDNVFRNPYINLKSVWWRWTAPASGPVDVSTFGSQAYTVLGAYSGNSIANLVPLAETASGDAFNGYNRATTGTSRLSFNATEGETYHLLVQGAGLQSTSAGPLVLDIDAPPGVPSAPSQLTATVLDAASARLDWKNTSTEASAFRIEFSLDGAIWEPLAVVEVDSQSYIDRNLPGTNLSYRLRAEGPGGVSGWVEAPLLNRSPLDLWKLAQFGTLDGVDLAADPDGDGLVNLFEWIHALDPFVQDPANSPSVLALLTGDGYAFTGRFAFLAEALQQGSLALQSSADGSAWSTIWTDADLSGDEEHLPSQTGELILVEFEATDAPVLYRLLYLPGSPE